MPSPKTGPALFRKKNDNQGGVMSGVLKFLGGLLLVLLVAGAAGGAVAWHKAHTLQRDGAHYVETNLPLIVANWNPDEVFTRAAPEFLVPSIREGLPRVFQTFSELGKLRSLGTPKGNVTFADFQVSVGDQEVPMPPKILKPVWARYAVDAEFDAGSATVIMDLLYRDQRWQIVGVYIKRD